MNPNVRLIIIVLLTIIFVFETRTVLGEAKSPPYFEQQPSEKEILFYEETDKTSKQSFEIPCEAKGDPEPNYFWTKNGQLFNWTAQADRIIQEKGSGTLKINSPKVNDAGQYQCFAENIWGIATSNSVFARKIELGSFKNEKPIVKRATEGQPFSLQCQAPGGYPKPKVNWVIQDFTGKLNGLGDDPRITVDPEGTLWFSNIILDDSIEDSLYACAVTSPFVNEVKTGAKVILLVTPRDQSAEEPKVAPVRQYTNKEEEIVTSGKKTRLYCIFGGTPLPTITWYKNGDLMKFRRDILLKDGGKSIEIRKATPADEANYTCQASNGVGDTLSHTIALKVQVEPRFVKKPENAIIDEQETVEFHCQATGNPTPEIIWIHNGKPLSEAPFNPRRAVSSNSIIIEKLWKNDTGNYGCNATNDVGYVYQDAYVNVLAEPPNITQLPRDGEVIEGGTVMLSCRAVGSPKPRILWIRNDAEIVDDRFTATKNGDLTIKNATLTDTGEYTCLAQNKISSVNISANLSVRQRTKIPAESAPSDTEIPAGETATLRCSALVDPSLELAITWQRNGELIDFSSDQHFLRNNDSSLIIPHTSEQDSGMYTCVASTRLDEVTAEAALIVQDIPNAPALVSLSCDAKDATISWKNTGDNRAPIRSYVIEYSTNLQPDTWEALQNVIPVTETEFTVKMAPWTNYTFRVLAVNKIGKSLPSEPSSVCTTSLPEVPNQNPNDVTIRATNESKALLVSWEPMGKTHHNGPGFHYNVSWKRDTPDAEWESQTVPNWETGEYTVPNVLPNTKYLVKVTAGNDLGQSALDSKILDYNTPPDIPYKNPDNVTVGGSSPTTLDISWKPMPKTDQNGPGFHYNVSWKKDTPEAEWETQTISNWETGEYKVPNVIPYTKYLVKVSAGNELGQSALASEILQFNTLPDIPSKNPENVTVEASPTTLDISWKPVPKNDQNGPGFHYNVSWKRDTPEAEWESQTISNWETGEYKVPNIIPYTKYLVKVTAGNDLGQSVLASEIIEYNTPPQIPSKNPDNVTVEASLPTTLDISWKPMPKSDQNGPGFHYNISWKRDTPEAKWETQTISNWEIGKYTVSNTLPYTKYLVEVTAGNDLGQSALASGIIEYNTPPDIPSKNPDNVTVRASSPTTLEIFWKPMPKNDQNGPGFHYNISWKRDTPTSEWQSQITTQLETGEYTVHSVLPYEKYLVTVAAGNDLGLAKPSAESFACQTPPDVPYKNPEHVTVRAIDPTTLLVSWEPLPKDDQNGPGFYYKLSWKRNIPEEEQWQNQIINEWETDEYTVFFVLPFEKYLVTITAGNDLGQANLTSESISYITPSTIPFKNPDNVTIRATGPTTSVISWKPMPKTDHNGPGFYYDISWKIDAPEMEWESQRISEWETGEYTIDILPYEKHFVTVVAGNALGQCNQTSVIVEGQYQEDVPLEAPKNLTLVEIVSATKASVSWNRVPTAMLRGNFQGYKIETWSEKDQVKNIAIIEQNYDNIILDKLTPNTKNKIRILVFNGKHDGPFSEELEIDTPEGVPEPVQSLEAKPLGSSALSLIWKPPFNTNGRLTGYKIGYQTVSGTELGPLIELTPQITDPNKTQFKLTSLEPDTNYRIIIQATTNAGDGEKLFIEQKTKPTPSSPLIQPDFELVPVDSENSTAVKVIWLPCGANIDPKNCNDQPIGSEFYVDYALKDEEEFQRVTEKTENNVIIRDLQPNKEYKFIVSSVDGILAEKSTMKSFQTQEIPTNPEKRVASEQTATDASELVPTTTLSMTEETTPDISVTRTEEGRYESNASSIMWLLVLLSIILLAIVIILIVIYLKKLNEGDKYIVREQEAKNGRPDWPEDSDFQEVTLPLKGDSPAKPDRGDMVMIPLN